MNEFPFSSPWKAHLLQNSRASHQQLSRTSYTHTTPYHRRPKAFDSPRQFSLSLSRPSRTRPRRRRLSRYVIRHVLPPPRFQRAPRRCIDRERAPREGRGHTRLRAPPPAQPRSIKIFQFFRESWSFSLSLSAPALEDGRLAVSEREVQNGRSQGLMAGCLMM